MIDIYHFVCDWDIFFFVFQVFSSGSPTIEESGLEALKRIVRTLSKVWCSVNKP